jgi:hypothetical protein
MQLGLTRRNIGRLILLAWAVALAWLARRQLSGGATTAERVGRLPPGAQFFAVMAGDRQIGQLNRVVDTLVDGVRLTELMVLDVPEGDSTRQLARLQELELTRGLRLRRMTRSVFGVGLAERLEGVLGSDSALSLRTFEANAPVGPPFRMQQVIDPVLPVMVPLRVAFEGRLQVGRRFALPVFDLSTGLQGSLPVTVSAESTFVIPDSAVWSPGEKQWVPASLDTIRAFRLDHQAQGAPTVTWVDQDGALVSESVQGGYTLRRSAFEIVSTNYRQIRRTDSSAWRRSVPGLVALASAPPVRAGAGPFRITDAAGDSLVRIPNPLDPASDSLARWRGAYWDTGPLEDRNLRAAVQDAIAGAVTSVDSAANLTRWVASHIRTDLSPVAFATVANALQAGRAHSDGKVRLLVAMARAAGIPARIIRGIAVTNSGAFAHGWAELWAGRWIAADPVLGQFPAANNLVSIAVGGRGRATDLIPLTASARFLPLGAAP